MDFKSFLAELEKNDLPDDHEITFTISDFAEVMHYTGEYLDDAMRKTDFIDSVCGLLLEAPFFDKEHETVKELLESDAICDFEGEYEHEHGEEALETEEYQDELRDALDNELRENWFEYSVVDYDLIQYDYKRGRVDLSFTREFTFGFCKEHRDAWWPSCNASVDLPSGMSLEVELS
jgi:hypothetical protein